MIRDAFWAAFLVLFVVFLAITVSKTQPKVAQPQPTTVQVVQHHQEQMPTYRAQSTAIPPVIPHNLYNYTNSGKPYTLVQHRPEVLRYCFSPSVPEAARPVVAFGIESWGAAYPIQPASPAEACNLVVDFVSPNEMYSGSWGEAWGNICWEKIEPQYIINIVGEVFSRDYSGLGHLAAHEMGHILCLSHTQEVGNVMHMVSYAYPKESDIMLARQEIHR